MISLDTETTGLDLRHGAKPFLVTICDDDGVNQWWEWEVDPLTRQPIVECEDLEEIQQAIDDADSIVLQNAKFDVAALQQVFAGRLRWDWSKVYDTLLAGHLLASNEPHDLTSMVLIYLDTNVQPYEDRVKQATNEARRLARRDFDGWRIAKVGLPEMPSAKGSVWKNDMWLPRAFIYEVLRVLNFSRLPPHLQQPTIGRVGKCTVQIDRQSKWGNFCKISEKTTREEAVRQYVEYILHNDLLNDLPELYGEVLGCHCSPKLCHGDVLKALCHPWWTVCNEYANSDSTSTIALFKRQREILKERNLWCIYKERLKILPIVYDMEKRGITVSRSRLEEASTEYQEESTKAGNICTNIAKSYGHELELPKSGNNKSLTSFLFGGLSLPIIKTSKKTGKPSLDKEVMETYEATLPRRSKALTFVQALKGKRRRDTALAYMESYQKFWLPNVLDSWCVLHPSLNPTGTDTLRWSSQNPNEQNISKQEGFNLRYCFGPAPGREWWTLDAKNIELRIPAYEAGETEQIALFEKPNDPPYYGSNHLFVCHILHPKRFDKCIRDEVSFKDRHEELYGYTKNGNFAVQYGAVEESGTADRAYHVKGAQRKIQGRFRKVKELNKRMIAYAQKHGYVETIPDKTVDPDRGYPLLCTRRWGRVLPTVPLNYHVQGTAMWWMMKAMIRCAEYLNTLPSYYMVMQVHDEIVFDFPKAQLENPVFKKPALGNLPIIRDLQKLMEQGGDDIGIPTPVSVVYHEHNWSEGVSL